MLDSLVLFLLAQAAQPLDPLSQRMVQFCRSKPACVDKQRQGVRDFLNVLTRHRPAQPRVDQCLKRSTRNRNTDWAKAASCLRSAGARPKGR